MSGPKAEALRYARLARRLAPEAAVSVVVREPSSDDLIAVAGPHAPAGEIVARVEGRTARLRSEVWPRAAEWREYVVLVDAAERRGHIFIGRDPLAAPYRRGAGGRGAIPGEAIAEVRTADDAARRSVIGAIAAFTMTPAHWRDRVAVDAKAASARARKGALTRKRRGR